jgi:hypothetical protein
MSISSRVALAYLVLGAVAAMAAGLSSSITPQVGGGISNGTDGGISKTGGGGGTAGALMMVNGTNFVLKVNATDHVCLARGGGAC